MKVFIGADHRGYNFKKKIVGILEEMELDVVDVGTHDNAKSCDYPKIAYKVAGAVAKNKNSRGLLVCMSGIGLTIAANKVRGAYAALCYTQTAAKLSREHNNSNILVIGAKFVKPSQGKRIIKTWFATEFAGGRHQRRVNQIKRIEKGQRLK